MASKIFTRKVMMIGREPECSLIVTIPRKICNALGIGKGTRLYFKLEGNSFIVSKDCEPIDDKVENSNGTLTKTGHVEKTKKDGEIIVGGISLADLQY
ncbi:MAG: AbrB/MazE/SpoVT family DNA-binding domain-containing protein [Thaumarchaeota archaeon]|nr:AbrB/MazE/SpoVT family DNA-binding domain-containing protein [Nitrososphaerota archaeon]